ncbi:MAG: FAD-dependent oxidoreductase [Armatimonadetes bacterium]|nr:FAD-dependent oxidoreductase [Armatimonadota bacterium]
MARYRYLIVGGGMTADAAIRGIREVDAGGSIGLIGSEPHPPYNRPPLSKGLWKGKSVETIWRKTQKLDADLHLGRTVGSLDATQKRVQDDRGADYTFEKLLLATGGTPRRLSFGGDRIIYYRTFDDYQALRGLTERGQRFAVIGAGFIGSEIAAALAMNKKDAVMLLRAPGIGTRTFPDGLSRYLSAYYRDQGVEVLEGEVAAGLEPAGELVMLSTQSGKQFRVDGVVAGVGIEPNTVLARSVGLTVQDGIVVDEFLRTSHPDIYAAGDVAQFYNPVLDQTLRVEHEDNANTMGKAAGRNMAGASDPYHHLPYFYSDLFDLGYEAVGDTDPRLQAVEDWQEPYHKGVVYYMKDRRVRGVLLWNVWDQVDNARTLIAEPGPFNPGDLRGRLPA